MKSAKLLLLILSFVSVAGCTVRQTPLETPQQAQIPAEPSPAVETMVPEIPDATVIPGTISPSPAPLPEENGMEESPSGTEEALPEESPEEPAFPEASDPLPAGEGRQADAPPDIPEAEPASQLPQVDPNSWELILANATHEIGTYAPELVTVENGQQFDTRAADALREFIAGARAEGLNVYLSSAYRGYAEQKYLYDRKVSQYGEAVAKTIVLPPGTSEHQTGLSADITDRYYETKDASLENTAMYQWMYAHCAEYGFILRYPKDKEEITAVIYEPWHFRYVGREAAAYIMEQGLCLEEFLALYDA